MLRFDIVYFINCPTIHYLHYKAISLRSNFKFKHKKTSITNNWKRVKIHNINWDVCLFIEKVWKSILKILNYNAYNLDEPRREYKSVHMAAKTSLNKKSSSSRNIYYITNVGHFLLAWLSCTAFSHHSFELGRALSLSTRRRILFEGFLGILSMNSTPPRNLMWDDTCAAT